jgi:hypothetical protein
MFAWFRALIERVKQLVLTEAVLDLESQSLLRHAERQVELLRRAAALEAEGLHEVAKELRRRAGALDIHQPLALMAPTSEHQLTTNDVPPLRIAEGTNLPSESARVPVLQPPRPGRKGS